MLHAGRNVRGPAPNGGEEYKESMFHSGIEKDENYFLDKGRDVPENPTFSVGLIDQ